MSEAHIHPRRDELIAAAGKARERAYAPYSGYRVGAAVLDEQGRVWPGCNVENVSYSLTICAERAALARLVSEGGRIVREAAVLTVDGGKPCGACLQALLEFAEDPGALFVHCASENGPTTTHSLNDLLPMGFASARVPRTAGTADPV